MPADHPVIRIEISGIRGAGKSVLAAQFHRMMVELGIGFSGPHLLPKRSIAELANAVAHLKERGLSVEFVETQTGTPPQVDARLPPRPRLNLGSAAVKRRTMEFVR
jgi:hypothetical protein